MNGTFEKTQVYGKLLRNRNWLIKRKAVLERDNNRCRNCGSRHELQVHHRQYHFTAKKQKHMLPWEYHARYLITLCRECHQAGHKKFKVPTFIV